MQIENTTLNSATHIMNLRHCVAGKKRMHQKLLSAIKVYQLNRQFDAIIQGASQVGIKETLEKVFQLVLQLEVTNPHSDYRYYYQNKGEQVDYLFSEDWNEKQKSVYFALSDDNIHSVIDLAGNTGWYSIMAAKMGKQVVALDIDEGCVEELYGHIKQNAYQIVPLWCSLTNLTKSKYAIHSGKPTLLNFAERMRCDAVMALGIVHHLILGLGLTFEAIFKLFDSLCQRRIILEFVEMKDDKIQQEAQFFEAFANHPQKFEFYTLANCIDVAKSFGYQCEIRESYPNTRKILVFDKTG